MIEPKTATISALRARLAALGGTGVERAVARPLGLGTADRAAGLGFVAESSSRGEVFVRRLAVDLGGFLGRAGLSAMPPTAQLLALVGHPCAPGGPAWVSGEGVGVLDIESLGLHGSGVMAFLVGLGIQRGDVLEAEQYLLVDPDGEEAMLGAIAARICAHRLWLTYNGRSFDVPVLAARCTINRLDPSTIEPRLHGDLLGPVRRLFRDRLGPCTLRHAEMSLLNHHRVDDVPGFEAPGRYRAWLRGAPNRALAGVVVHNLQDIVSTVVVGARLAAHVGGERVRPAHAADRYLLGRHLERQGVADGAETELRAAVDEGVDPWARQAAHRLALVLQRRGAAAESIEIWRRLHESDRRDLRAARGYAIRLERTGDLPAALEVCLRVRAVRAELGPWWARLRGGGEEGDLDWDRRRLRLQRRLHS
ncbi:MAG: ribonuclease H-like domain-containing protein [Candidatus Dormibacteraeota bacterium]|uniref:Ribonuclease H-like domain-containing protein n=1 Tax=Candidatus Amunia macphersoniae TaxID=3127014 RepID=A0A934KNJ4_9BACT|nr:ribonuclease H-like domain-containing protein [Candidatus Dormibacteraeota bacterium]